MLWYFLRMFKRPHCVYFKLFENGIWFNIENVECPLSKKFEKSGSFFRLLMWRQLSVAMEHNTLCIPSLLGVIPWSEGNYWPIGSKQPFNCLIELTSSHLWFQQGQHWPQRKNSRFLLQSIWHVLWLRCGLWPLVRSISLTLRAVFPDTAHC